MFKKFFAVLFLLFCLQSQSHGLYVGSKALWVDTSKVGIGTKTPVTPLHVVGSGTISSLTVTGNGGLYSYQDSTTGPAFSNYNTNKIYSDLRNSTGTNERILYVGSNQVNFGSPSTCYGLYIDNLHAYSGVNSATETWGVFVAGGGSNYFAGKVGIGTNAPSKTLDVSGTMKVSGAVSMNSAVSIAGALNTGGLNASELSTGTIPSARLIGVTGLPKAFVSFGSPGDLDSITFTFTGSIITATKTSHGLSTGDTVSFSGQSGNNTPLNGYWPITVTGANTFTFVVGSTPAGSLSSATGKPVRIFNSYNVSSIQKLGTGWFVINFTNSIGSSYVCTFGGGTGNGRQLYLYSGNFGSANSLSAKAPSGVQVCFSDGAASFSDISPMDVAIF